MRRDLIATVAAAVSMVLLAMLVPLGVLLRSYALEDRISRAALEVQATETVVSGQDKGTVAVYLERINDDSGTATTVLYPDGTAVGPDPSEDAGVREARQTGQARLDDVDGGAELLVPVSLGGSTAGSDRTPVVRVRVTEPGLESGILRVWVVLLVLGLVLLLGALVLADRIGRGFVQPIRRLAAYAGALGDAARPEAPVAAGPSEVRELQAALVRLVERIDALRERERRQVSDLSHRLRTPVTALRLRIEGVADPDERARLTADLDDLEAMVDHVVRQARRTEREGLVVGCDLVAVARERIDFWSALAEDQGRPLRLDADLAEAPVPVDAAELAGVLDVLLDNVFTHTPDGTAAVVTVLRDSGAVVLRVDDAGPGLPPGLDARARGTSGAGSTGLGLSIADACAADSAGSLHLSASPLGGARVELVWGAGSTPITRLTG